MNKQPRLKVTKKKAVALVKDRILLGNKLLQEISGAKLDIAELGSGKKYRIWSDYNFQLLQSIFLDEQIPSEYKKADVFEVMPISVHNDTIESQLSRYTLKVSKRIERLESLLERMGLFSECSIINRILDPIALTLKQSRFIKKRFWYDPWTIKILGGIVSGLIVIFIVSGLSRKNLPKQGNDNTAFAKDNSRKMEGAKNSSDEDSLKQKMIKVQINRIIQDANQWLNNNLENEKKKGNDMLNELSFHFPQGGYSGTYIGKFIQNTESFWDVLNDYFERSVNRKIEDLLLKEKELRFSRISWLREEYNNYLILIESAKKVKMQIEESNLGFIKRFANSNDCAKLSNKLLGKKSGIRVLE